MSHFETKEQYLQFISAWKSATNAEECKSKRVVCDHNQYYWNGITDEEIARLEEKGYEKKGNYCWVLPDGGHCKEPGWLHASHYLFYNMMKGRDPFNGFTPKLKRKCGYGENPWTAFENAAWHLEFVVKNARAYVDALGKGQNLINDSRSKDFLVPFNGKIKIADLLKIDVEELAKARKFHR